MDSKNPSNLRQKYQKFIYDSFACSVQGKNLLCQFNYSLPPDHVFTHKITFVNLSLPFSPDLNSLIFHIGLAEMFSYWKLTCSPKIIIAAGNLSPNQLQFWHKLLIRGMGQYFYENHIDFTRPDFVSLSSTGLPLPSPNSHTTNSILVPIGGGKDSVVTAEILKNHYPIRPLVVTPATPACLAVSRLISPLPPIIARRDLDPLMLNLTRLGYLAGHIPYSSVLAFISLFVAACEKHRHIAVSNETSSDEGNVSYIGRDINHQYSKTSEFEQDFQNYISALVSNQIQYFSFLRPLHELQIAKLFSRMDKYFSVFKSCNRRQKENSWCGKCPKCVSTALVLSPWIGPDAVEKIMGANPLTDPENLPLISQMQDPTDIKPFECVVSTKEAQVCLEFISQGQTPRVTKFLATLSPAPNLPEEFFALLKQAYAGP